MSLSSLRIALSSMRAITKFRTRLLLGEYGVDLWRWSEAVEDSFAVVVPRDAAAGRYDVRVRLLSQPHYPNYRLSDYFFDDDYYSGRRVSTLDVRRGPAVAGGS